MAPRTRNAATKRIELGAAPAEHKAVVALPRVSGSHAVYPGNNRRSAVKAPDSSSARFTATQWAVLAVVAVLAGVGAGRAYGPLALPSSAALSVPPCALHARLAPWTRQLPTLQEGLRRVCTSLATADEKEYPEYETFLQAWRQRARPTFLRFSAVVSLLVIPCARYVLDIGFQALGRQLLPRFPPSHEPDPLLFTKWREACWRLTHYAGLAALGILSTAHEPWLRDTQLLWQGWPHEHEHTQALVVWYSLEFGLYLYALADLLFWEAVRGDYYSMIIHHTATLSLLAASFHFSFLRAGCVLLMLNDFVDLWFEGAKLAKYAAAENVSTGFFLAFVLSWAWLRQLYAPFQLIPSLAKDGWVLVETYGPGVRHVTILGAFLSLVFVLVALHTYWFVFLCQKIKVSVSIHVSVKVVDRRPNAVAPAYTEALMRAAAGSPQRHLEQQQRMAVPTGLDAHTDDTLLEED